MRLPSVSRVVRDLVMESKYVFSSEDLRRLYGLSPFYAYRLVRRLIQDGVARRLHRGLFILDDTFILHVPREAVIDSLFDKRNYYIGLRYALLFWKLHDAPTTTIHVLTNQRRWSGKQLFIANEKFQLVYLSDHRFFGYVRVPLGGSMVNISDREKTLIDSLLFIGKYVSLGDICKALKLGRGKINVRKMVDYAIRVRNQALVQRLGYLLESAGFSDGLEILVDHVGKNYVVLNPAKKGVVKNSFKVAKWRLYVNDRCL